MQIKREGPPVNPASGAGSKSCLRCQCTDNSYVTKEVAGLEFAWSGPAPRAGQFFMIKPEYSGVFLARPVSAAGWQAAEGGAGALRFLVLKRGRGTEEIARIRPGERAELSGPLGNSWAYAEAISGRVTGKTVVALVSGGVGVAPLACYARELDREAPAPVYDFYAGFKSGAYGLEGLKPRSLVVAAEDGSERLKGRIPDFFSSAGYGAVFACGPEIMLKTVAAACAGTGTPCFVSLERRMACGSGACLGCTVRTWKGGRRCCADGPVFNAGELCFDS